MRWGRIEQNGKPRYAIIEGDRVLPINGSPFEGWEKSGETLSLSAVKLLIPVVPGNFYAAGMNYAEHAIAVANARGEKPSLPKKADIGYRANNALIADGETIVIPKDAGERVQYEGELVAVVGKKAKHLTEANALSCILGYTIGNDVSERDWQQSDRTFWRSKNTDTFKPMGPWIETDLNLDELESTVRLNGQEVIRFKTDHMIFSLQHYIATITQYDTLNPGDVIWCGTEGAAKNMKDGDVVEVEINKIGVLKNPVIREK